MAVLSPVRTRRDHFVAPALKGLKKRMASVSTWTSVNLTMADAIIYAPIIRARSRVNALPDICLMMGTL